MTSQQVLGKNRPQQCKDAQVCTFEEGRQHLAATRGLAVTGQPVVGPVCLEGALQNAPWEPPNKPAIALQISMSNPPKWCKNGI